MRLIVAGGRDFTDYFLAEEKLGAILSETPIADITILDGCANGVYP